MNPHRILLAALLLALALPASAQAPARIAFISPFSESVSATRVASFKRGMHENGLVEGRHFTLDIRYANGHYDRFPALTEELLQRNPAVLLVVATASVHAAQRATRTVPIVFVGTNDPVGNGLVASLARPGGNTTGLSPQVEDVMGKYVELLHEALPRATRVAVLTNSANLSSQKLFNEVRAAAGGLGIAARAFEAASPAALDSTFGAIVQYRPDALLVLNDALLIDQRERIASFALGNRIATLAPSSEFVAAGALISYAAPRLEMYRRAATYVKKILAGTKPADLPVEQPTRFELAVNLKTAKQLNITLPYTVMLRATEVIE